MSETYCLKINEFHDSILEYYQELRENKNFGDVTLVCEEGAKFDAHTIILAASSPVLSNILLSNQHPKPFIYMKGIKSKDLSAILDFVYCGKAKIQQSDLTNFILLAEELKIKGLAGDESEHSETTSDRKGFPDTETDVSCLEIDNIETEEDVCVVEEDVFEETDRAEKDAENTDIEYQTVTIEKCVGDVNQQTCSVNKTSPMTQKEKENSPERKILSSLEGEFSIESFQPTPNPQQKVETTQYAFRIMNKLSLCWRNMASTGGVLSVESYTK